MSGDSRAGKALLAGLAWAVLLAATPALAEKPSWAGDGRPEKHAHKQKHKEKRKDRHREAREEREHRDHGRMAYFGDHHRVVIRDYYSGEFHAGHCPPGLAKKRNGCMPPGQAKKWRLGRPLPREVVYYELPPAVAVSLGPPPAGHRFVRVAGDILMIAIGTAIVVDALQDLGGL